MGSSRVSWVVLCVWALASALFATSRAPFDDEWFSLTLLTDTTDATFWRSLIRDVHPPWWAMVDRAIWSVLPDRFPLHLLRALACVGAVALWLSLLRPVAGRRIWWLALALCHPIVFYYGGALRWYPFLMAAHALRHWAILSEASGRRRSVALVAGAGLGLLSGYVDALFLAHDLGHFAWRERSRLRGAIPALTASVLVAVAVLVGSPIAEEHWALLGGYSQWEAPLLDTLTWVGLGPVGEALPHAGFLLLAPAVALAAVLGGRAW
ncbi:MAG: hypothetical protein QF464_22030, partial [Myxococcota bacterium]|nr:hypothetical protein [Myxococcota bacterium]